MVKFGECPHFFFFFSKATTLHKVSISAIFTVGQEEKRTCPKSQWNSRLQCQERCLQGLI